MFVSARSVENRIGRERMIQLFDRNLDNEYEDEPALIEALADADKYIRAILRNKGFTDEQLDIISSDELVRRQAAWIVAHYGAMGKPELMSPDGTTFYDNVKKEAIKTIQEIADATLRPDREKAAGPPQNVRARIAPVAPDFQMAPTLNRPAGRGGF